MVRGDRGGTGRIWNDERKDYNKNGILSLQEFHNCKMLPGEAIPLYLFKLKRLLGQAMAGLAKEARDQLLFYQFLVGLPESVSQQLRGTGDTKDLERLGE